MPGTHHHVAYIHPGLPGRFQQVLAEKVISHAAHHGDIRTQPGTLKRLIGAFSTGGHVEGFPINGLAGGGNALRSGDDIHHEAADNKNLGFSVHV